MVTLSGGVQQTSGNVPVTSGGSPIVPVSDSGFIQNFYGTPTTGGINTYYTPIQQTQNETYNANLTMNQAQLPGISPLAQPGAIQMPADSGADNIATGYRGEPIQMPNLAALSPRGESTGGIQIGNRTYDPSQVTAQAVTQPDWGYDQPYQQSPFMQPPQAQYAQPQQQMPMPVQPGGGSDNMQVQPMYNPYQQIDDPAGRIQQVRQREDRARRFGQGYANNGVAQIQRMQPPVHARAVDGWRGVANRTAGAMNPNIALQQDRQFATYATGFNARYKAIADQIEAGLRIEQTADQHASTREASIYNNMMDNQMQWQKHNTPAPASETDRRQLGQYGINNYKEDSPERMKYIMAMKNLHNVDLTDTLSVPRPEYKDAQLENALGRGDLQDQRYNYNEAMNPGRQTIQNQAIEYGGYRNEVAGATTGDKISTSHNRASIVADNARFSAKYGEPLIQNRLNAGLRAEAMKDLAYAKEARIRAQQPLDRWKGLGDTLAKMQLGPNPEKYPPLAKVMLKEYNQLTKDLPSLMEARDSLNESYDLLQATVSAPLSPAEQQLTQVAAPGTFARGSLLQRAGDIPGMSRAPRPGALTPTQMRLARPRQMVAEQPQSGDQTLRDVLKKNSERDQVAAYEREAQSSGREFADRMQNVRSDTKTINEALQELTHDTVDYLDRIRNTDLPNFFKIIGRMQESPTELELGEGLFGQKGDDHLRQVLQRLHRAPGRQNENPGLLLNQAPLQAAPAKSLANTRLVGGMLSGGASESFAPARDNAKYIPRSNQYYLLRQLLQATNYKPTFEQLKAFQSRYKRAQGIDPTRTGTALEHSVAMIGD